MTKKGMNVPVVMRIPSSAADDIERRGEIENEHIKSKDTRTKKAYLNPMSGIRRVADYIYAHMLDVMSYEKVAKDLDLDESSVYAYVRDLNAWEDYPLRTVPLSPKKAGHFQVHSKDVVASESYLVQRMKCDATRQVVTDNLNAALRSSRKPVGRRVAVEQKQKIKKRVA